MTKLNKDATFVGIDPGTNTAFMTGSAGRNPNEMFEFTVPMIVDEVPRESVPGVFDTDRSPLIGNDAVREFDYLNICRPLAAGGGCFGYRSYRHSLQRDSLTYQQSEPRASNLHDQRNFGCQYGERPLRPR